MMTARCNAARPMILLVDDEEEILVALSDLLEDDYRLFSTTSPLEALEILHAHPDIITIISDQRMPGLMGDRFLAKACQLSDARSILLTGYADLDAVVSALNDGHVQAYVHKPWDAEALKTLVAEVTKHGLAQRALRTEQALLRGLMDALPIGLVFSDAKGRCIRSNRMLQTALDTPDDEVAYHSDMARHLVAEMRHETAQNGQAERLVSAEKNDSEGYKGTVWHELTRFSLAWPPQASYAEAWQVSIERDVTRRMAVEARLRQAERLESLGTLAGGVAHDFNNLLAVIAGSLDLLEEELPSDNDYARQLLTHAHDAVRRGVELTRRLLQCGRARQAGHGEKLTAITLGNFLSELRGILEQSVRGNEGNCHLVIDDSFADIPAVLSDPQQLEMALLNLCVNARDAMPDGGVVRIRTRLVEHTYEISPEGCCPDKAVVLEVCDEGEGMPPEVIARIFDPFFTTKAVGRGTGLGLSGVYGFMRRSHGDVLVESSLGQGTTMTLVLPIVQDVSLEGKVRKEASSVAVVKSRCVLVMDDEEILRQIVTEFLQGEGMEVHSAATFGEALALFEMGYRPDLAVLDVQMPGKNGPECARHLRSLYPGMAVLFMSGHINVSLLDGHPVISKPFTQEQLRRALNHVMSDDFCIIKESS